MRMLSLLVVLLVLGFPQLARAAGCGGSQANIPPVLGIHDQKEYGRIWMHYNADNDTYCSTMTLRGSRENKPTQGRLNHDICAAGLNGSGTCKGPITRASQEAYTTSSFQFGPIRVAGDRRCIKTRGSLSWTGSDGAQRAAFGETPWKCYRP